MNPRNEEVRVNLINEQIATLQRAQTEASNTCNFDDVALLSETILKYISLI